MGGVCSVFYAVRRHTADSLSLCAVPGARQGVCVAADGAPVLPSRRYGAYGGWHFRVLSAFRVVQDWIRAVAGANRKPSVLHNAPFTHRSLAVCFVRCTVQAGWTEDAFNLDHSEYIWVYVGTSFFGAMFMFVSIIAVVVMVLRAGRSLHRQLLQASVPRLRQCP